jgi:hypothetical protein
MIDQGTPIQQAKSMAIPKRWPLVNTLDSRDGEFLKDARLVNAYAEKDKVTQEYQVEKRPGFALTPAIEGSGIGQGMFTYEFVQLVGSIGPNLSDLYLTLYVSGGNAYYVVTDFNGAGAAPTLLGPVHYATGNRFQFLGIPTYPPQIIFSGNNTFSKTNGTAYVLDNGVMTTLVGGDSSGFPKNTVPGFVYLDGFIYVMDYLGTIWETANQNVVTGVGAWGALDFVTAASDADIAVQLARQLIYVVAIKTWTTQFYYDAGNATGSSLSPVPGALYNFGCLSADTFCDLDGVLFWATRSKAETCRIVMVDNLNIKFVSNPAVERQLGLAEGGSYYSVAYQQAGHRWYIITNTTSNVTMAYDIGEDLWYLWTDYAGNFYPVSARSGFGVEWQQMISSGNIYVAGPDYTYSNDYGNIVPVDIYTPNFDAGVDRVKYLPQMRFNTDQNSGGKLWVRFSEDDYKSWNNFRYVDLGRVRPLLNDEGSFYRRAYHFRHYANKPMRIRSVDLQMDIGIL